MTAGSWLRGLIMTAGITAAAAGSVEIIRFRDATVVIARLPSHIRFDIKSGTLVTWTDASHMDVDQALPNPNLEPPPLLLKLPTSRVYHRPDCRMVASKPTARPITAEEWKQGSACLLCKPPQPQTQMAGTETEAGTQQK